MRKTCKILRGFLLLFLLSSQAVFASEQDVCLETPREDSSSGLEEAMYVVTFLDYDGSSLFESVYLKGETVMYPDEPVRKSDGNTAYRFREWVPAVEEIVEQDITYTAVYEEIPLDEAVVTPEENGVVSGSVPEADRGKFPEVSSTSYDITVTKLSGGNDIYETEENMQTTEIGTDVLEVTDVQAPVEEMPEEAGEEYPKPTEGATLEKIADAETAAQDMLNHNSFPTAPKMQKKEALQTTEKIERTKLSAAAYDMKVKVQENKLSETSEKSRDVFGILLLFALIFAAGFGRKKIKWIKIV